MNHSDRNAPSPGNRSCPARASGSPDRSQKRYIDAIEYVNQFFMDKAYLEEMKQRTRLEEPRTILQDQYTS